MPIRSQYEALHNFTRKISESFERKGFVCRLISPENFFKIPVENPPDLTFGLNGVPINSDGTLLCDLIEVPHFAYLIDPPYRFFKIFKSPYLEVGCDDRYCCEFLKKFGFDKAYFLPHGVDQTIYGDPREKKKYEVLMLATYIDYESLRNSWREHFPKIVSQIMDDAIEMTFSDDSTSFIQAFALCYMDRLDNDPLASWSHEELTFILSLLEEYIKGKERVDLITSIKDAKILLLNGHPSGKKGWESVLKDDFKNISLIESINYEKGIEIMKESKIVLNSFSKNKEGGHDRIFNGFAAGALVLTNENIFMKENFEDEKNILFYSPRNFSNVNEKLNKYLSNDSLREVIALRGREEVMAHHTWDCRIDELIKNGNFLSKN